MADYKHHSDDAQPIRACFKRILLQVIANAAPPSEQKAMIMTAYENDIIGIPETFALIHIYGLAHA